MILEGRTRLDLLRNNKVVHRVEKHNTITGLVDKAINEGNFHYMIQADKIMPVKQWFEGCLLTDKENNANLMMIAGDSEVVAQAGNDAYTGTNTRRGSFNSNESGIITGGYRFVFDWATSQGNGTIASVCLTRNQIGIAEYFPSNTPATLVNEFLHGSSNVEIDATLGNCIIIDYENEVGYDVYYDSGTITVDVYHISTSSLHLVDERYTATKIATHNISQSVDYYALRTASLSYTGDTIHLITFQRGTGNLKDYAIDLDDWTCTATSHTYSGVEFNGIADWRTVKLSKDAMPIINGYLYALSKVNKIVKCNLSNDADVTEYDNPWNPIADDNEVVNGPSLLLPNGDWYKFTRNSARNYCLYYHNGVFNKVKINPFYGENAYSSVSANGNDYGTVLCEDYSGLGNIPAMSLMTFFPYVSTVNNLEEAVTKSADLTMKLTYEITEVTS